MKLYPYKFAPIYHQKLWGGRNLERLFARRLPAGQAIGESWELADLNEAASAVVNGPQAGTTLTELTRQLGDRLLGGAKPTPEGRFPLLLKLLDAAETLSLQVHPDAEAVRAIGGSAASKTECWYVLESRGGYIYKGLLPDATKDRFRRAVERDTVEGLVRRQPVAAGDFHYLPAGTVHALGAGVVVAEVQTPSDTTYRVTDWGRGREIHPERSIQCIHFDSGSEDQAGKNAAGPSAEGLLLATPFFTVSLRRPTPKSPARPPAGRCSALMFVTPATGGAQVRHGGACEAVTAVADGETVLLPANLKAVEVIPAGDGCAYLEITLPA